MVIAFVMIGLAAMVFAPLSMIFMKLEGDDSEEEIGVYHPY